MWPILRSVICTSKCENFDKCDPFYRVWITFPSLSHLAKCDQMWPIFAQGGSVAEWLGRRTWNPEVAGSSPALTTKLELFRGGPQFNSSVMFVYNQLVCLPPVGIFKPVMFIWNICFFQFEWHACELACVAKCMTTINKHLTFDILPSVTPTSKCDNFDKCDPFYRVWLTFPSLTHLAKCDPFCAVWLVPPRATILISVTHLPKFDPFGQMWRILRRVTRTSNCDNFDKCDPFYRVWLTFPSLTHLAKRDPFCPVWLLLPSAPILISVTHFIECDSPSQVWPIWPNVTHFAQCDSYFQVRQFW